MRGSRPAKELTAPTVIAFTFACLVCSCDPEPFSNRHIPIRWVELHAPRHPECKGSNGLSFRAPLPTREPVPATSYTNAWRSSEWINWMIDRLNVVYDGTGIDFWLQSHDVYCTEILAKLEGEKATPYAWTRVREDLRMMFPHADMHDFGSEKLERERWLEKAFLLYGDPHGLTLYMHNDYVAGTAGDRIAPEILPQHGYGPWYTPAVVFMFLSGITKVPGWEFDPELTVAHEIGHALGNCHTIDIDSCIVDGGSGDAVFPDGATYSWADHWDLAYVNTGLDILGFANRNQARQWVQSSGTSQISRIDDRWNIVLEKDSGAMSVRLAYDPSLTFWSQSLVPTPQLDSVRLLQGLSFDLDHSHVNLITHLYAWQRNIMSYRYPEVFDPHPRDDVEDPYDYLTARFSLSQIETMQRHLRGSTPFIYSIHGSRPPGTEWRFASQFSFLGDGVTQDVVWYSNGEGPAHLVPGPDVRDMIAFRGAPAGTVGLETDQELIAGDFNGDDLADLLWYDEQGLRKFLWSRFESQDGVHGVHHWDEQFLKVPPKQLSDLAAVFAGDFDGNGADDLFLARSGTAEEDILYFKRNVNCRNYSACLLKTAQMQVKAIAGPVAVGDFDGRNGDDFLWSSYSKGDTYTQIFWSNPDGTLSPSSSIKVGDAEYVPFAGNFNGTAGDDVLWYNPSAVAEIIWWGAAGGPGDEHRMMCGPGGSNSCIDNGWNVTSKSARLTIGDFDGNGADDIMIHDSHEPEIFFSSPGGHLSYPGHFKLLQVALRNSDAYLTAVGDFDNASDGAGRLGDDIFLYYRPVHRKTPPKWLK